jgi:streptogramin lyase
MLSVRGKAVFAVLLLMSLPALFAVAASRPAPVKPATTAPADSPATPTDASAAPEGSVQDTVTMGDSSSTPRKYVACNSPGKIVTCLFATDDFLWVGTEDRGVWRLDLKADPIKLASWKQFTTRDGLGDDNAYAITRDKLGRIWVGLQRHGVAVYNGASWQTYDVLDGPLGERVFDIAVCPTDGDVWITTNGGLTRYSVTDDCWSYVTLADGLPSSEVNCLAFDSQGTAYVGTQCNGIAVSSRESNYKNWRIIPGPENETRASKGAGLPINQINRILVTSDDTVYVATTAGLAASKNRGASWQYVRGRDYPDKVKGLSGAAPMLSKATLDSLLPDDYVTTLFEDGTGRTWVGCRQGGLAAFEAKTGRRTEYSKKTGTLPDDYVSGIVALPDGRIFVATYGEGLVFMQPASEKTGAESDKKPPGAVSTALVADITSGASATTSPRIAMLPTPIRPPTRRLLRQYVKEIEAVEAQKSMGIEPSVVAMPDDWRSRGDWIDRYGRFSAVLCAMGGGGNDLIGGYFAAFVSHRGWIGRNATVKNDQMRRWVQWITTEDPRCLQCLSLGGRKQSEWDDHGEVMPLGLDGPHVYGTLKAPPGRYYLSLYFVNKDGHWGWNRLRDFTVSVKVTPLGDKTFHELGLPNHNAEAWFNQCPGGAQSRVRDFWGGVYKRFYVDTGKESYITIKVDRNHSFCTILSGIFLDPVGDLCGREGPYLMPAKPRPLAHFDEKDPNLKESYRLGLRLLDHLLYLREARPAWYAAVGRPYLLETARLLADTSSGKPRAPGAIAASKAYAQPLRKDMADLLDDLHLFDLRDLTFYGRECFDSYVWKEKTTLGRDWENYTWNKDKFQMFTQSKKELETW